MVLATPEAKAEAAAEVGQRSGAEAMPHEEHGDTSGPRLRQQSGPQQKQKQQQQQQTKSSASTSCTECEHAVMCYAVLVQT